MRRVLPFLLLIALIAVGSLHATKVAASLTVGVRQPETASQPDAPTVAVTRGPYLQLGTPTSLVIRWRTDVPSTSRVLYGPSSNNLAFSVVDNTMTAEHVVTLTGLVPDSTYFYAVGTASNVLSGGDDSHFFVTSPVAGTDKATRIWVLGDSGTGNSRARQVRDAYYAYTGSRATDLWLMLGDNAYTEGTDAQYQTAVFDTYSGMLQKSVLWPAFGNHDALSASSVTQSGPYYDIFSLPTTGQAGGVASGTEAYFSFDYATIHFVVLNSEDTLSYDPAAMIDWLSRDLAASNQRWTIALWHRPPYSKGSHDSDTEGSMVWMRANIVPTLEEKGVDLVLVGHSHAYERSFLLDGHYGPSTTLTAAMIKNGGDGRADSDGPYVKQFGPHHGAVYAVVGSSGTLGNGPLNHPAMATSQLEYGSMVLDVQGNRLDAVFLSNASEQLDSFTIVKQGTAPSPTPTASATATATQTHTPTAMATETPSPTATATSTVTPSPTATLSPTATPTVPATPSPTAPPSPTATPTATPPGTLVQGRFYLPIIFSK